MITIEPPRARVEGRDLDLEGYARWRADAVLGRDDYRMVVRVLHVAPLGVELTARCWSHVGGKYAALELITPDGFVVARSFAYMPTEEII